MTIEDLEALQELNDELEENHVETERSLHEEIGVSSSHGMLGRHADCNPQNRRIPTSENLTRRSSLWKSLAKTWNIPSFGSVNWSYNCKSMVTSVILSAFMLLTHLISCDQ